MLFYHRHKGADSIARKRNEIGRERLTHRRERGGREGGRGIERGREREGREREGREREGKRGEREGGRGRQRETRRQKETGRLKGWAVQAVTGTRQNSQLSNFPENQSRGHGKVQADSDMP